MDKNTLCAGSIRLLIGTGIWALDIGSGGARILRGGRLLLGQSQQGC
jgi:hypothetical protein